MTADLFLQAFHPDAKMDGSAVSRLLPIIRISGRKNGARQNMCMCMCMCIHTFSSMPEEGRGRV